MDNNKFYSFSLQDIAPIVGVDFEKDYFVTSQIKMSSNSFNIPFRPSAMVVFVCTKGRMDIDINLQKYNISAHTITINLPGNILYVNHISDDFEGYVMIIDKKSMEKQFVELQEVYPFYVYVRRKPSLEISEDDTNKLIRFFTLLEELANGPESKQKEKIVIRFIDSLLYQLYEIYDIYCTDKPTLASRSIESYFQNFMELVSKHFRQERNVTFYAEKLCISSGYLSEIVKQYSGRNPLKWIDAYTLMEAKTLLRLSPKNIQEIAYYLNFSNQSSFGKYFKKHTGVSPKHYREMGEG